jgi:hypothetical protein
MLTYSQTRTVTLTRQTRLPIREGVSWHKSRNCLTTAKIWSWVPEGSQCQDGLTDWLSVAKQLNSAQKPKQLSTPRFRGYWQVYNRFHFHLIWLSARGLLGCDVVQRSGRIPTFQRSMLPGIFWIVTPCSVVVGYQRSRGLCCLYL